jgi:hypothetical protein
MKLIALAQSPAREWPPGFSRSLFARRPTAGRGNGGERCSQNSHISAVSVARMRPGLPPRPLTIIFCPALSALRAGRGGMFLSAIGIGRRAERSNASGVSRTRTPEAPLRQGRNYVGRTGRRCCSRCEAIRSRARANGPNRGNATMTAEQATLYLALAGGLSSLIGYERQWRNRLAGCARIR